AILDKYDEQKNRAKLEKLKQAKRDMALIEKILSRIKGDKTPTEFYETIKNILEKCHARRQLLASSGPMIASDAFEFDTRSYRAFMDVLEEIINISSRLGLDETKLPLPYYTER